MINHVSFVHDAGHHVCRTTSMFELKVSLFFQRAAALLSDRLSCGCSLSKRIQRKRKRFWEGLKLAAAAALLLVLLRNSVFRVFPRKDVNACDVSLNT